MPDKAPQTARLALTENDALGKIEVDLEAYFDFHFQLAEQLEDMVAEWQHRLGRRSLLTSQRETEG